MTEKRFTLGKNLSEKAPTLDVIIVSWNVQELLSRCLTTLREDLMQTSVQATVWVIDNASTDGSAERVARQYPWVRLETPGENLGYVRGNNRLLSLIEKEGCPDFVWLLNPDTEIRPGAVAALLQAAADHPRAGLIGPQLRNPDGSLQPGAFHFPGLVQPLFDLGRLPARWYETPLNGRYPRHLYESHEPFRIDHPLGAAMLARTAAVAEVGPLDERFFMYCEEIDWAWRMRKAGWESWLVPQAEVIHYGGASSTQVRPVTTAYLWESRARLYRKHHTALTFTLVSWIVRRTFRRLEAPSPEWSQAYRRIVQAWEEATA